MCRLAEQKFDEHEGIHKEDSQHVECTAARVQQHVHMYYSGTCTRSTTGFGAHHGPTIGVVGCGANNAEKSQNDCDARI
jgi:hypothetical protein